MIKTVTKLYIWLTQQLVVISTKALILSKGYKVNVTTFEYTQHEGPIIVVSNHSSSLDPFVIISYLPKDARRKMLPMKFMTANEFYFTKLRPIMFAMGCFPARARGSYAHYGIKESVRTLKNRYSLLIFPEGKRVSKREPAKNGIIAIKQDMPDTPMLFCQILWDKYPKTITLKFEYKDKKQSFANPDSLMDAIYAL